jgi:anti-anti-sigma factor
VQQSSRQIRVGYASNNTRFSFWAFVEHGARSRARELGMSIDTLPAAQPAEQAAAVHELIGQSVDVLIVSPIDARSSDLLAALQAARAARIPIMTCESGLAEKADFAACDVCADLARAAELATEHLLGRLGPAAKLAHLAGQSSAPRRDGFYQALSRYPGAEVVSEQVADWTREHAAAVFSAALADHPEIEAVFVHSDEMALGAVGAIAAAGRSGTVLVSSVDAMPEALSAMRAGAISATVSLAPHRIGRLACDTAAQLAAGAAVPPVIEAPVTLVTPENLLDVALEQLIQLPQIVQALGDSNAIQRQLQQQVINSQRSVIRELSSPIVPISEGALVLPLIGAIDSTRAQQITETLLEAIGEQRADTVIVDITGIPVVDTRVAHHLLQAAQAARLLGAQVILVGITPEVAQTIVQLGINMSSILTYSTLREGLRVVSHLRG